MRITIFLFIVGLCLASAKFLSYESKDSNVLLRIKRSDDSDDSSSSVEQDKDSSENDASDDDETDEKDIKRQELEDKLKRKALERQEKEKRKKEEEQRKLEEKRAKEQRKEEEKKEKEERKRAEKLENQKRKEEEKLKKEEQKNLKKQRKELEKLEKEANQSKSVDNDFLETEEENSMELSDVWKQHIYLKYGLTLDSTKLEKQAALNRYLQEELGLNQNSTERERYQAVIQLIQTKLQNDVAARTALRNQLLSHINAVSIQKLHANIEKDLEELNNKTEILNNVSLTWVPVAKQQIEERRSFLQTISQFLSNILPNWVTGGQNVQKPINSANGPDSVISSKPLSENNVNSDAQSNVATGISGVPPTASQSNNDVISESNGPSSTIENSPAQGSSQISTDIPVEQQNTNNKNTESSSTNTVGSEVNDGSSTINQGLTSTGMDPSINNETPSGSISLPPENGDNIASTSVIGNTGSVDNGAVPSKNGDALSIGTSNNDITSVSDPVVNPTLSYSNANTEGDISASTTSNYVQSEDGGISSTNNTNVGDNASLVSISNTANGTPVNPKPTDESQSSGAKEANQSNTGDVVSASSTDDIISANTHVASQIPIESISSDNPSNVADQAITPSTSNSQANLVTSDSDTNISSPGVVESKIETSLVSSERGENTSVNNGNVAISTGSADNAPNVTSDTASSGTATSGVSSSADNSQGNKITSASGSNVALPGLTENTVDINVVPSDGGEIVPPNDANVGLSSSSIDNTASVAVDAQSTGSSFVSTNNNENPTSNIDNVIVSTPTTISVEGNIVAHDNSANGDSSIVTDVVLSQTPAEVTPEGISINSSNLPSTVVIDNNPSVNLDVESDGNSYISSTNNVNISSTGNTDILTTISDEKPILIVADNVITANPAVISAEGNGAAPVDSASVNLSSTVDIVSSGNSDVTTLKSIESNSVDGSNLPSRDVSNNAPSLSSDTVPSSVTDNTSDGNITSSGGSNDTSTIGGVFPVSVDAISSSVTESSSVTDAVLISSTTSTSVSGNYDNVVSSNVVDNSSPVAVIPEAGDSISTVEIVASNGIDNAPVTTDRIVAENIPSESSPVTLVGTADPVTGSSTVDVVSTSETGPVAAADSAADLNNVSVNFNKMDTTLAPEIINSVQLQDKVIDNSTQTISIVTESPDETGKLSELATPVSDIIISENTLSTGAPSEAPQVQTSQSSVADTVTPTELSSPVVVIDGITIPEEPGASVVEILPQ